MPRLPERPPHPFGSRCNGPKNPDKLVSAGPCGQPRVHLGMTDRGDVWLCTTCDMGPAPAELRVPNFVRPGPPRLMAFIRTGDMS